MSDAKLSLAVLQRISEFLADLPEQHLSAVADGSARLTFIPADTDSPRIPKTNKATAKRTRAAAPSVDMTQTRDALAAMDNRADGRALLEGIRLKAELTDLAKLLGMAGFSSLNKPDLIEAIVEFTIGSRLNSAAIRNL